MYLLKDENGTITKESKSINGVKRWAIEYEVETINFYKIPNRKGKMSILFCNKLKSDIEFDDYYEMLDFARRWRKAYGAKIFSNNEPMGFLSLGNFWLDQMVTK